MNNDIKKYPAPWDLNGKGYIFLFKFKKNFVDSNGYIPDFLKGKFAGGFGSVMLVNYENSNAGPYNELLFIPGKFKYKDKKLDSITKIYVSTMESVINGRINWGIPKEKADFIFSRIDEKNEKIQIMIGKKVICDLKIKSKKFKFPISTKLLPFPLVQRYENKDYYTNFYGKGKGRFAKIVDINVDGEYFPDIKSIKPIATIGVEDFKITFPKAEIRDI